MTDKIDWTDEAAVAAHLGVAAQFGEAPKVEEPAKPEPEATKPEPVDTKPAKAEVEAPAVDESEEEGDEDGKVAGVRDKRGKFLPYGVLVGARKEAQAAKQELAAAKAELAALKAQPATTHTTVDDDFKSLEDADFPKELIDKMRAQNAAIKAANAKVEALEKQQKDAEALRQKEAEQEQLDAAVAEHAEAIGKFPLLKKLEANNGPMWQEAVAISDRLLDGKPLKSVKERESHYREVEKELRETFNLPVEAAPAAKGKPSLPTASVAVPGSLSHLPGGAPPATSEAEAFMSMDPMKAVATLSKMTPEQMSEFIGRSFGG